MVSLMQRRREMMKMASSPTLPLYSFDNLTKTGGYQQYYITNGNHFKITGSRRNYEADWQFDKGVSGSQSTTGNWTTPMFYIPSGSTVRLVLQDLSISSTRSGYMNFGLYRYEQLNGTKLAVGFRNADGTGITYTTTSTTGGHEEISAVSPDDATAHYFGFYIFNSSGQSQTYTIEFDLELYVDGVRYI